MLLTLLFLGGGECLISTHWGDRHPIFQVLTSHSLAQAADSSLSAADRLLDRAQQQYQKGQLQEALETYQKALTVARQGGSSTAEKLRQQDSEGAALTMVGLINARLGHYQKGLETLEQAIAFQQALIDRAAKEKDEIALQLFFRNQGRLRSSLSFLGLVYERLGQPQKALELNQDALSRSRRSSGDYGLDGEIFNNIGMGYFRQNQPEKALEAYYRALVMVEQVGYPLGRDISSGGKPVNFIQANQAVYNTQPLPRGKALTDFLEQAIAPNYHTPARMHPWARYLYVMTLNNIGTVYAQAGRSQAQFFYLKALESSKFTRDLELEATSLNNVGSGYEQSGAFKAALTVYQQALEVSRKLGDRALEGKTLNNIGTLYLKAGDHPRATQTLTTAMKTWESLRPGLSDSNLVSLMETQTQTYEALQTTFVAQQKIEQALEISERGRARAFVEMLARRLKPVNGAVNGAVNAVKSLTIAQIQQIAREQQATLVEYSIIGNDTLYIWVVNPQGTVAFRQVNLKPILTDKNASLTALVETVRSEGIGVRGRGSAIPRLRPRGSAPHLSSDLQRLYQVLIAPIAELLPKEPGAKVVFIPQGALFLVPFAALQNAQGKYLIEQYTIALSPSIQVLELARQQQEKSRRTSESGIKTALIVGNPTMPRVTIAAGKPPEQLSELPGSEEEARAIAALLNTKALTGDQATETTVVQKMATKQVIHLATHGLLDDFLGLGVPGAIALAPSSGRLAPSFDSATDGLLTANEILDLKLNSELVVLSACDTGRGRITGDGVIGLSRSLILAGTPSVIVSLWAVPDAATATLMTEFYRAFLKNPDKAQALRQAMLTALKQYPNPRDWAAFTLVGEGK
jgi:CHAT domain-containing protein/Tfp pilus assembly protein PilF